MVPYEQIDKELTQLMRRFGPHRKHYKTHYPFWRLQQDKVLEVTEANRLRLNNSGDAFVSELRQFQIHGGLTLPDYRILQSNPALAQRIAESLVGKHFPPSLHEEILASTFFPLSASYSDEVENRDDWLLTRRRWRDPSFRPRVLSAYGSTCAVCEFSVRFVDQPLAIEAAHIKWHEYKGPPIVENGIALCALHHRLFDRGAFTILPDLKVKVSPAVQGVGVDYTLGQYDSKTLRATPLKGFPLPHPKFLRWHGKEVFRSPEILKCI